METTTGAQFNNLFVGEFPVGGGILMLLADTLIYLLLAIYFDLIIPKEYGQQYHPLFFIYPSFWFEKNSTLSDFSFNDSESANRHSDVEDISTEYRGKEAVR